jgi:hypothetical protein
MTKDRGISGSQPEVLAGLAAAAKAGGQKPKAQGLQATAATAPVKTDVAREVDAATRVLREGATGKRQGAAAAVRKLPDRARKGDHKRA